MSGAMKTLVLVCVVLWVMEHIGFDGSAYITGYLLSHGLKEAVCWVGTALLGLLPAVI